MADARSHSSSRRHFAAAEENSRLALVEPTAGQNRAFRLELLPSREHTYEPSEPATRIRSQTSELKNG